MNKIFGLLLIAAIVIWVAPNARGLGSPEAPLGVATDHWISMGDAAGFVITDTGNDLRKGLRTEPNVVKGYFMIRHGGNWVKIESSPGEGVYKTLFAK